jgi:hypothetical protein
MAFSCIVDVSPLSNRRPCAIGAVILLKASVKLKPRRMQDTRTEKDVPFRNLLMYTRRSLRLSMSRCHRAINGVLARRLSDHDPVNVFPYPSQNTMRCSNHMQKILKPSKCYAEKKLMLRSFAKK